MIGRETERERSRKREKIYSFIRRMKEPNKFQWFSLICSERHMQSSIDPLHFWILYTCILHIALILEWKTFKGVPQITSRILLRKEGKKVETANDANVESVMRKTKWSVDEKHVLQIYYYNDDVPVTGKISFSGLMCNVTVEARSVAIRETKSYVHKLQWIEI